MLDEYDSEEDESFKDEESPENSGSDDDEDDLEDEEPMEKGGANDDEGSDEDMTDEIQDKKKSKNNHSKK